MEIRKRNGESVPFQQEKVFNAMKKAFDGQGREIGSRELNEILTAVLDNLAAAAPTAFRDRGCTPLPPHSVRAP